MHKPIKVSNIHESTNCVIYSEQELIDIERNSTSEPKPLSTHFKQSTSSIEND